MGGSQSSSKPSASQMHRSNTISDGLAVKERSAFSPKYVLSLPACFPSLSFFLSICRCLSLSSGSVLFPCIRLLLFAEQERLAQKPHHGKTLKHVLEATEPSCRQHL